MIAAKAQEPTSVAPARDTLAEAWTRIGSAYRSDESEALRALCARIPLDAAATARIDQQALVLAQEVRNALSGDISAEAFLRHYGLSTSEGVVLMCIAEALLRIPDAAKADELIRDKIGQSDWGRAIPDADSLLVNASTWALMLTGRLVEWREAPGDEPLEHPATPGRADQRADHPGGTAASDARHGRAVRDGTDHRARAAACQCRWSGRAIACPTTCWARLL